MEAKLYPSWGEKVIFSAEGPQPEVLAETDTMKVVVAGLQAGQVIPPHPETQGVYYILEGQGWMTVGEQRFAVAAGSTIIVPKGTARGLEAEGPLSFLAVRVSA